MNLLAEITLRWYDDSSLYPEERRTLVETFLKSIGVNREVAVDVLEVLLNAKSKNITMTSGEIREAVVKIRKTKNRNMKSLTMRNIQVWLKYFRKIGLLEKTGDRYIFKGNHKPSKVFKENIKPEIIDKTSEYITRLLEKIEEEYEIK